MNLHEALIIVAEENIDLLSYEGQTLFNELSFIQSFMPYKDTKIEDLSDNDIKIFTKMYHAEKRGIEK